MSDDTLNPKDRAALKRIPLHYMPDIGRVEGAKACVDGAFKYDPYNWRDQKISLSGYLDAIERHLVRIREGEWIDKQSGVSHFGHIIATASIVLDAEHYGSLINDLPAPISPAISLVDEANAFMLRKLEK